MWKILKQTRPGAVLLLAGMVLLAGCGGAKPTQRVMHSQKTILDTAVTFYQEGTEQADKAFRLEALPVTDQQKSAVSRVVREPDILEIMETGLLSYRDSALGRGQDNGAMTDSRKEAVALAEGYLRDMDLLPPKSDYFIQANSVTQTEGTSTESKIVEWTINFYHAFGGVPMVDQEREGIQFMLTSDGISSFQYRWSQVIPDGETAVRRTVQDPKAAIDRYAAHMEAANRGVPEVVVFRQVYVCEDGQAIPAWVFGDGELFLNSVYIDALTGEIIKEYSYV